MKNFWCFLLFSILNMGHVSCQTVAEGGYALSREQVKEKSLQPLTQERRGVHGIVNNKIVIYGGTEGMTENFLLYDEKTHQIAPYLTLYNTSEKVIGITVKEEQVLKAGFMTVPDRYRHYTIEDIPVDSVPYQDLWIQNENTTVKIDAYPFHFIDKPYDANFSSNGQFLIVSPYTNVSAGYWPESDNRFYLYDLSDLKRQKIKKRTIMCDQCMNVNMIGENIILVKEIAIGRGRDGFFKNIYITPKDNINDTLKIAHDINIIRISPDGKYILGEKYLYGEYTPVILNVALKRFQYLLGREYPMSYSFYSPYEKKFAFDFGTRIVYIDFPSNYPFDALSQKVAKTSKAEDAAFWRKYQHKDLK